MTQEEILKWIAGCPYNIDEATIPKAGIEANPAQVVGTLSLSYEAWKELQNAVKKSVGEDWDEVLTGAPVRVHPMTENYLKSNYGITRISSTAANSSNGVGDC